MAHSTLPKWRDCGSRMLVMELVRQATRRWGAYPVDLTPLLRSSRNGDWATRKGWFWRMTQVETRIGRSQGSGRWATTDNTARGQQETVVPVTHIGTSEPGGNSRRAIEREWIWPAPCRATCGGR